MEPLNKRERVKAYYRFLLFFLITVVVIILAVFINYQIPMKENKILRVQYEQLNKELEFQTSFSRKMNEVQNILDSINNTGQNVPYLEQLVSTKLAAMKESIPVNDSLKQRKMYDYTIQTLLTLQDSKRNLRDYKESQVLIKQYEDNIQKYKDAYEQSKRDLDICRQLSNMGNSR